MTALFGLIVGALIVLCVELLTRKTRFAEKSNFISIVIALALMVSVADDVSWGYPVAIGICFTNFAVMVKEQFPRLGPKVRMFFGAWMLLFAWFGVTLVAQG